MNKEFITHEAGNEEAWICICKNRPEGAGFYPCDNAGNMVEPTDRDWPDPLYVCDDCGRIIHVTTLEVLGVRADGAIRLW